MKKRKSPAARSKQGINKNSNQNHPNSLRVQRQRLLSYLRNHKSITTIEARKILDIMSPATRILELRAEGWEIITEWVTQYADGNTPHRVGKYVLQKQSKRKAA